MPVPAIKEKIEIDKLIEVNKKLKKLIEKIKQQMQKEIQGIVSSSFQEED